MIPAIIKFARALFWYGFIAFSLGTWAGWGLRAASGQTSGCMPTTCQCTDARYCR